MVVPLIDALVVALMVRRANDRSGGEVTKNLSGVGFAECDLGVGVREPPALVVGKHGQLVGVMAVGAKRVRADCSWGGCSTAC